MPTNSKRAKVQQHLPTKVLNGFTINKSHFAIVTPSMDSFRIIVKNTSNQTITCDYTHPTPAVATGIAFGSYKNEHFLALCLEAGSILIYSISEAILKYNLEAKHSSKLADFCFSADGKRGWSLDQDGNVFGWNIKKQVTKTSYKSKIDGASKIAVSASGDKLVIAGNQIEIVKLGELATEKTLSGHATQISQILLTEKHIYSIAEDDRFISRWTLRSNDVEQEKDPKLYVVDSIPKSISVGDDGTFLALLENGAIALWDVNPASSKGKPDGTVELNSENQEILNVVHNGARLLLAYGSVFDFVLERVAYLKDKAIQKNLVITRSTAAGTPKKSTLANGAQLIDGNDSARKAHIMENLVSEPTIEDQVKALIVDEPTETKQSSQLTVTQLLSQALHSGDVDMLERALSVSNRKTIYGTVRGIHATQVIRLIDAVVIRIQKQPNRAIHLIEWLRACLTIHSSYLLSVPKLTRQLGSLHRMLEARQAVTSKLVRLSGRIDMVLSQMDVNVALEDEDVVVFDAETEMEQTELDDSEESQIDSEEEYFEDEEMEE
ncbi:WD repeat-containing protein 43 [Terramyces sp. JEL0728]|nr:WD repeat-containing protein 43 [Terramyces sp. JEL0728]